jgi:hypothetical protein
MTMALLRSDDAAYAGVRRQLHAAAITLFATRMTGFGRTRRAWR